MKKVLLGITALSIALFFSCSSSKPKDIINDGGYRVVVEMSIADIILNNVADKNDSTIVQCITRATELKHNSDKALVDLFINEFSQKVQANEFYKFFPALKPAASGAKPLSEFLNQKINSSKNEAVAVLTERLKNAEYETAKVEDLGNEGRILVEIPGITDKEMIRGLLHMTAHLEFYETFENREIIPLMDNVNLKLKEIMKAKKVNDSALNFKNLNDTSLSLLEKYKKNGPLKLDELNELNEKDPLWIIFSGLYEFDANGTPSGFMDGPCIGYATIKDTSILNNYFSMPEIKQLLPKNLKLLWSFKPIDKEGTSIQLIAVKTDWKGDAQLSGNIIKDVRVEYNENNYGRPSINLSMTNDVVETWRRMTANNLGKSIAVVIDDLVYMFPVVQGEIPNGFVQITGDFTKNEANQLANLLKSGHLGYSLRIIEETVVPPLSVK